MGPDPRKTALLSRWESDVFRAAVSRLQAEHRLPDDWEARAVSLDDHVSPDPSDLDTTDGPLGPLPRLVSRHVRLEERLARLSQVDGLGGALAWLSVPLGTDVTIGAPEIRWKTTGLTRAGVVFQLGWPRLATRVGIGLDANIAACRRRPTSWVRSVAERRPPRRDARGMGHLDLMSSPKRSDGSLPARGPLGVWDLSIDRVGPDPFDAAGLGRIVTLRWPLILGAVEGSMRTSASRGARRALADVWPRGFQPADAPYPRAPWPGERLARRGQPIALPRGLRTLRATASFP